MRMTVSDEDLALQAGDGDREAFSSLLHRHYDRLFALAFRLTGQQTEAEDLTQDICAALPRKLGGFRGEARFSTWLYRVAVNAAHDRRRRAATHGKASEGWGDWEQNRRAADAEDAEDVRWLRAAMSHLSEDLRDTLALTLDHEMTQGEAAKVLGVSEGTVAWRMSEVKKRLKEMHQEEMGG